MDFTVRRQLVQLPMKSYMHWGSEHPLSLMTQPNAAPCASPVATMALQTGLPEFVVPPCPSMRHNVAHAICNTNMQTSHRPGPFTPHAAESSNKHAMSQCSLLHAQADLWQPLAPSHAAIPQPHPPALRMHTAQCCSHLDTVHLWQYPTPTRAAIPKPHPPVLRD